MENKWQLEIESVSNGYIIKGQSTDLDRVNVVEVIIKPETEEGDLEAMQELLYKIKEYFGVYHSKHNKKNLEINIVENKEKR